VDDTEPPVANASIDIITVDQNFFFTFNGNGSTDNIGIVNYTWDFYDRGDKKLFGMYPSYLFIYAGQFIITLTVTDGGGNSGIDTMIILVNDTEKPNASAIIDLQADEGRIVLLQGKNSKDNVGIANYTWIINDNGIKTLFGELSFYRFNNIIIKKEFEITLNVTDAAGNWDTDTKNITIYEDTKEPVIHERFPKNNQKDVNIDVNPRIVFDEDIDPATVEGNVSIGISGKVLEVEFDWDLSDDGKELTLIPAKQLIENQIYTVLLTNKIKDMAGNNLSAGNLELESSFGTEESFETLPFTKSPEHPKHGDLVKITIIFNKDVDERTVTPRTVKVTGPRGDVPLNISFPGNKSRVIVTLVPQVESEERYVLNVSGDIKDYRGTELGDSEEYAFTCSKREIADNNEEPWNIFGLPIFFIFLFILAIAVIVLTIYVILERRNISSGKAYDDAVNQLKSRKRQMDQLKRIGEEEKINEKEPDKRKGLKDFSFKAEDIKPRKRSTKADQGKVSYYNPREDSTFAGKTYDVADPAKERSGRRRSEGRRSPRGRRHHGSRERARDSRSEHRRRGDDLRRHDRRDRRRRPPPRESGDVEWG